MPHRRSPPLAGLVVSSLGLAKTLLEDLSVLVLPLYQYSGPMCSGCVLTYGSILGSFRAAALECDTVALVLEALGSNQTLDLGCLGVGLGALLLGLNLAADNELANL
jgi:hypothetical protein